MPEQLDPNYTAAGGAWKRFGWTLFWGAVASAAAYVGGNLPELAGKIATQPWWPLVVPLITAGLAAFSKWVTEKQRGN